jgi:hypothetical protein
LIDRILDSGADLYASPRVRRHARLDADWPPKGAGLPIGAFTSQLFASYLYLEALDHFVKRELKVEGYVRYVDDLFLFSSERSLLERARNEIADHLLQTRKLRLKSPVRSCFGHCDALGARVRREGIQPMARRWASMRAAIREELFSSRHSPPRRLRARLASLTGGLLFGAGSDAFGRSTRWMRRERG